MESDRRLTGGSAGRRIARLACGAGLLIAVLVGCGGKSAHPPARTSSTADRTTSSDQVIGPGGERGVYHPLEAGQTLYRLSLLYDVSPQTLLDINGIEDPTAIPAGSPIFIPGADRRLSYPAPSRARLTWPLRGAITSRYGVPRGRRSHHAGLDIDGDKGDKIHAAAGGRVLEAGRSGRYGKYVLIDHGNDLQTLYAHASRLLVKRGERVDAGEPIALVGRTGNAQGTHLHFELRRAGQPIDPMPYLSGSPTSHASSR